MKITKLVYRRQFLLGPQYIDNLSSWNKVKLADKYFLTVHPDLSITMVNFNSNYIILLGYLLDPSNPSKDNVSILEACTGKVRSISDIFYKLDKMCGRFVIILKYQNDFIIFNDATGMREIFYFEDNSNNLWCASQSEIIAQYCNVPINEKIKKELFNLSLFSNTSEYWYPGDSTIYENLHHLTPNHYLNLNTHSIVRYWPVKRIRSISLSECVRRSSTLLKNILVAACNRFNIAMSISAGYDSRILIAASKDIKDQIYFFSHTHKNLTVDGLDIRIPAKLLPLLNLKHNIVNVPMMMDVEFEKIFRKNVTTARTSKGLNAYGLLEHFKNNKKEIVLMNGNLCEIARRNICRYPRIPQCMINERTLSLFAKMGKSYFANQKFYEWWILIKELPILQQYIIELFQWEQKSARWAATTFSEMDISFENLSPFNCKELLILMMGVDLKYRTLPNYSLYRHLIKNLWPETLQIEINPHPNNIDKYFKFFVYKYRIYEFVKFIYLNLVH